MRKKKKAKIFFIILGILLLIGAAVGGYFYLNKENYNYTYNEKKWITENDNHVIDLYVNNELPIFSYGGEGVYYKYIEDLSKDTNLTFNTVTSSTNYKFDIKNEITDNDLVFYEDHFVVISDNKRVMVNSLEDLKGKKIGVLSSDASAIKYYLSLYSGISYTSYETLDNIEASLGDSLEYAILPLYSSVNKIISQNYTILYHLEDLKKYYTLTLSESDEELNGIMTKFFKRWDKTLEEQISTNLLELYFDESNIMDVNRQSLTSKDYVVGYTQNLPYEGSVRGKFTGITDEYLDLFSKFTGVSFKYNEYRNYEALEEALNSNNIDIIYNYKKVSNDFYVDSMSLDNIEYVVLAHESNSLVLNTLYGLKGYNVKLLKDSALTTNLSSRNIFTTTQIVEVDKLIKDLTKDDVIILNKVVYNYYKNRIPEFSVRYEGDIKVKNTFLLSSTNTTFNDAFNFFLSIYSSKTILDKAVGDTASVVKGSGVLGFIVQYNAYFICALIIIVYALYKVISKKKKVNRLKKEDKLIYRDKLTNLKNRNFLNDNIDIWDQNKIYPQSIITIDLNQVKYINDTAGHEEGDRQIQAAANILIKNQRENSEIIRTDGNEFLIYLVGYEEKVITTYVNRLNKEFKNLPYNYGASIGYSMITSEIKTVDDAINDALQMMREGKGENNDKNE